ncbi:SHOCT domain-containing protein [Longimycelium tulufanense]|uniref:SHOCT domain-containing protein n=1 Tax=Longimycelium tulufanense TaxID=907463 RepID=UPI00166431B9|nr:SHOCT domain-containing protein [Longimycelium tulufanense]
MAWQDELRQLDQAFGSGQITADEYNRRRDDILSTAARSETSTPPTADSRPGGEGANETTAVISPVPAATPTSPPQAEGSADATQVVPGASSERTQVVSGQWMTQQPTPTPPPGFTTPTPPPPAPGQANPGWQRAQDVSPPWAEQEWPPQQGAGWVRQGPEVFEVSGSGGKGKKIGAVVGIVAVLAGLSAGAWWLWGSGREASSTPAAQQTTAAQNKPSQDRKPGDILRIADLGGEQENHDRIKTFDDVKAAKFLTQEEVKLYNEGGAGRSRVGVTTMDGTRITIFVAQLDGSDSADLAVTELGKLQLKYAFSEYKAVPAGVVADELAPKDKTRAAIRAHYRHDNVVVRVEVRSQSANTDPNAVRNSFDKVIKKQLEVLSANA